MNSARYELSVTTSTATSGHLNYREFNRGMIHVLAGSSATTLTFHVNPGNKSAIDSVGDVPWGAAHNSSGAITLTVAAGRSYAIPAELAGANHVLIQGNDTADVIVDVQGD